MCSAFSVFATPIPQTLTGVKGKVVELAVESNPTTGYQWMIKQLPPELIFVASDYQQTSDCPKGAVGCPGKQTFTFIAQHAGTGTLQLIYGRSFDKTSWKEKDVLITIK